METSRALELMIRQCEAMRAPGDVRAEALLILKYLRMQSLCDVDRRDDDRGLRRQWMTLEARTKELGLFAWARRNPPMWFAILDFVKCPDRRLDEAGSAGVAANAAANGSADSASAENTTARSAANSSEGLALDVAAGVSVMEGAAEPSSSGKSADEALPAPGADSDARSCRGLSPGASSSGASSTGMPSSEAPPSGAPSSAGPVAKPTADRGCPSVGVPTNASRVSPRTKRPDERDSWNVEELFRALKTKVEQIHLNAVDAKSLKPSLSYLLAETQRARIQRDQKAIKETWLLAWPILNRLGLLDEYRSCSKLKEHLRFFVMDGFAVPVPPRPTPKLKNVDLHRNLAKKGI